MNALQTKILRVLRSPRFFKAILALFVIESVWIAVSAAYPMVFDENTHFGVIQLYAHRWNPVWLHQPPHAAFAGPLAREPSYMYQYLLSFPYRLLTLVTSNQMVQIIGLRLINVALFGAGLVLFRKLLLRTKVSPAIVHTTILFFVLTPVVPLLAGQINYDNLLMPLTALTLLLTVSIGDVLNKQHRLPVGKVLQLLTLCMFSSLVQFAFLPVFAATFLWLAWKTWQVHHAGKLDLVKSAKAAWLKTSVQRKLGIAVPLLLILGLFVEMYGVNAVAYHNLTPACDQVLSRQECAGYGSWQRNQIALAHKVPVNANPLLFAASWTYRMFVAIFYTSSGGASPHAFYLSINPLPIVFLAAIAIFAVGSLLVLRYHQSIFKQYKYLGFLTFVCLFYAGMLWLRNYQDFVHIGQKIAINGRYLFPILLPAMLLIALAYRQLLAERHHLKLGLVIVAFLLFLQGGGVLTYITASDSNWYWQNKAVVRFNQTAQHVVRPFIIVKTPMKSFGEI